MSVRVPALSLGLCAAHFLLFYHLLDNEGSNS
jgi:hypothetical protein